MPDEILLNQDTDVNDWPLDRLRYPEQPETFRRVNFEIDEIERLRAENEKLRAECEAALEVANMMSKRLSELSPNEELTHEQVCIWLAYRPFALARRQELER